MRLRNAVPCSCQALVCAAAILLPRGSFGAGPTWWAAREVVNTNAAPADYAAANLGQLKWFAACARDELDEYLPGGAGTDVTALVDGFALSNNHCAVNLGQLKAVAAPFYDRLIAEGYTNAYPWTTNTDDDANFALAKPAVAPQTTTRTPTACSTAPRSRRGRIRTTGIRCCQ